MWSLLVQGLFSLLGGLGLFLLGMHMLSEGLQTIAGSRLKRLISLVTYNRLMAVAIGTLVTTIIQSSSITTVLVVGFVNSGLMTLVQAIGVIMGANIGTTITGWILVLHVDQYGVPIVGISSLFFVFAKREQVRFGAMAILGVGMVFMGLGFMKEGLRPLKDISAFVQWFAAFNADGRLGLLKCIGTGCLLTMIVQSSSATLGITIAMASQGLIGFESASALVLGENIGTTITAWLAALGANLNARRSACFHTLFNICGVLWVFIFFHPFIRLVEYLLQVFLAIDPHQASAGQGSGDLYPYMAAGLAMFHTLFNATNTMLFIPWTRRLASFLEFILPSSPDRPCARSTHLDASLLESPFAALGQVEIELQGMVKEIELNMHCLASLLRQKPDYSSLSKKIFATEQRFDSIQGEVIGFLTTLLGQGIGLSQARDAQKYLHICSELEAISDYITQILKLQMRLQENQCQYEEDQQKALFHLHELAFQLFLSVKEHYEQPLYLAMRQQVKVQGQEITLFVRQLRAAHWQTLEEHRISPLASTTFSDTLIAYRKIKEHLGSISESIAGLNY